MDQDKTASAAVVLAPGDAMKLAQMTEAMAGVGYWRYDLITTESYWSPEVYRIHGVDIGAGTPPIDFILDAYHPDDRAEVERGMEGAQQGRNFAFEARLIQPSGAERRVIVRAAPERNLAGEVVGIYGIITDLTETRLQDIQRAEHAARFEYLAENASDIIAIYDLAGKLTYLSPSVEFILGYKPEELIGRSTAELIHPDDRQKTTEAFAVSIATEAGAPLEYRAIAKDGGHVWLEAHPKPLHDPKTGEIVAYQDAIRDVRQRKAMLSRLAEVEARYDLLAEHSNDLIMQTDLDGLLTYVSPSIRTVMGGDPAMLIGKNFAQTIHRADLEQVRKVRERRLAEPNSDEVLRAEYRARHINGQWRWFETQPIAIFDDHTGEVSGVLDVARDITQRKALESELEAKRAEAEAASVAKAEFLANMSHEIRTPLTGVIGFSDLLCNMDALPADAHRYADRIATAGRALLSVVNDILDFSKLEAGRIELDRHPFDLADFVEATAELVEAEAQAKGLWLKVQVAADAPTYVEADSSRLRQILLNLLTNAIKFTAAGGISVDIGYASATDCLTIAVTDTGAGIPEALQGRLFKRFSQVDGSITREHGGTGLGLAICKGLVDLMGGEIGAKSVAGQGSTFWFVLPAPPAEAPADAWAEAVQGADAAPAKILLVDDVAANRELVRALLSPFGHEIVDAESGAQAIAEATSAPFDLILMDLQMPGMDGLAATRAIRAGATPNLTTPIIALSANVLAEQVAACAEAGMNDHIAKPIKIAELLGKVAAWLDADADEEDSAQVA